MTNDKDNRMNFSLIFFRNKKEFDILPPLDYSSIVYDPPIGNLKKYFFTPPKNTMTPEEIKEYRKNLRMI